MNIISASPSFPTRAEKEERAFQTSFRLASLQSCNSRQPDSLPLSRSPSREGAEARRKQVDRRLARSLSRSFVPCCASLRNYAPFYSPSPKWPRRDTERGRRERGREGEREGGLRDTPGRLAVGAEIETAEEEGNFSDFPTVNVYYPAPSSLSRACPPCVCLRMNN